MADSADEVALGSIAHILKQTFKTYYGIAEWNMLDVLKEDDDDIGVERPEDVNLSTADDRQILKHETPHVVEVRAFPTEHIPPLRSTRIPSLFGSSTLTVCSYKLRTLRDTDTFGVNRIRTSARPCTCSLFPTSLRSSSGRDRAGRP